MYRVFLFKIFEINLDFQNFLYILLLHYVIWNRDYRDGCHWNMKINLYKVKDLYVKVESLFLSPTLSYFLLDILFEREFHKFFTFILTNSYRKISNIDTSFVLSQPNWFFFFALHRQIERITWYHPYKL